jgi:hypothetical protein
VLTFLNLFFYSHSIVLTTMLIITNPNDKEIDFIREGDVKRGTAVGTVR